jgi:ABC-type polar amino acid transport system ATPase subunit
MVFDDVLSGLDSNTEEEVFTRVFGPEGVLKRDGITAVLVTHRGLKTGLMFVKELMVGSTSIAFC